MRELFKILISIIKVAAITGGFSQSVEYFVGDNPNRDLYRAIIIACFLILVGYELIKIKKILPLPFCDDEVSDMKPYKKKLI